MKKTNLGITDSTNRITKASFTQQHYLSNKANVEEESYINQTSTEPIVNNNPDTENKNN